MQLTQAAADAGVRAGMTPTQALARCPNILLKTRSRAQEEAASKALIDCAYGFSPYIEDTDPGICTIDLRGNSLVFNSQLSAWAGEILARLLKLDLVGQIGIAQTPLMALHAAGCAQPVLIVENTREFLADLPIESLDPSQATFQILKKWGIHTIGAFTSLGKEHVAERLGPEALELFNRATADSIRPLRPVSPPQTFEEAIDFDREIETTEPLLFVIRRFLEQIALRLEMVYLVAEEIKLRLVFSHGADYERAFKIPAATREVNVLFRILDTHLETLRTPHPITGLRLSVNPSRPSHQQFSLFETALRDPNHFYETLARLIGLVGSNRVGVPVVEATHRPDAFRLQPVNFDFVAAVSQSVGRGSRRALASSCKASDQGSAGASPYRSGLCLRRFRPPLPAEVKISPDLRRRLPISIKTKDWHRTITQAQGPWLSSGDWWDNNKWTRAEWDVETSNGEIYRLCHQQDEWFVEAIYD